MNKPKFLPTDSTYPNPPVTTPKRTEQTGSPLMKQATTALFGLPWPRKPLSKGKTPAGKPGPKTTRSGVHMLGRQPRRKFGS